MLVIVLLSSLFLLGLMGYMLHIIQRQKALLKKQSRDMQQCTEETNPVFQAWNEIFNSVVIHSLSGTLIRMNRIFQDQLGYDFAGLKNQPFRSIFHHDYFEDWDMYISKIKQNKHAEGIMHLIDKQNHDRIFEYKASLHEDNTQHRFVRWIGREITEKINLSRKLSISHKKYDLLFDILPCGGAVLNDEGKIIHCSKNMERLTGYQSMEIIGKAFTEFIEPRIPDDRNLEFEIDKLELQRSDLMLKHKNGQTVYARVYSHPYFDEEDNQIKILAVFTDISEQVKLNQERKNFEKQIRQRQKMEALGTFSGGISHDFNNILAAILGFADLALDDLPDDHPVREYVQEIIKAGSYGRDLVRQILSFSRKVEQEFHPIPIKATLKQAVKLIRALIPANVEIYSKIILEEQMILSDAVQIQQILLNLATNAFHAMRGGSDGRLEILADLTGQEETSPGNSDPKGHGYIRIRVVDNGVGMDEATRQKIFEPFFTTKSAEEGCGLGLALVQSIVKNHQGHISVHSETGKGSLFTILLPAHNESESADGISPSIKIRGKGRILIIDDDAAVIRVSEKMLKRLGYEVIAVNDPQRALGLFAQNPAGFDLVITDQIMPKLSGFDLANEFVRIRSDIPIIFLSGHIEDSTLQFKKADYVFAYLDKPINPAQLSEVVYQAINRNEEFVIVK